MELGTDWAAAGLPGLFLASFLAATLLPFSSELVLAAMTRGPWSAGSLLAVASVGNTLGGLTNFGLGRWIASGKAVRRFGLDPAKGERWRAWAERYGPWCALLCWLPVIGDPLAIALGLVRARTLPVVVLMFVGKALRYAVVLGLLR
ncbi:MAG TPA: YqaA family protein [Flavobacteriales bacterium]